MCLDELLQSGGGGRLTALEERELLGYAPGPGGNDQL